MNIQTSTAKVYHGGNRRWFTKKAAERAEAWRILRDECCDCEDAEPDSFEGRGYPGNVCNLHLLREDFKDRAINAVLASEYIDPDNFSETIGEMVSALYAEQQEELKQASEQILTQALSL